MKYSPVVSESAGLLVLVGRWLRPHIMVGLRFGFGIELIFADVWTEPKLVSGCVPNVLMSKISH